MFCDDYLTSKTSSAARSLHLPKKNKKEKLGRKKKKESEWTFVL